MSRSVPDGALVTKDPSDVSVYVFDWDVTHLDEAVTISSSEFTITALRPSGNAALTKDQESILSGNRKTRLRLSGGTKGAKYRIDNKIVTSETPAQTKERSFLLLVEDL